MSNHAVDPSPATECCARCGALDGGGSWIDAPTPCCGAETAVLTLQAVDLDALPRVVPHYVGPPCEIEDEDGISDRDRAVAIVGMRARELGNRAAVTDPAVVACIRRRIAHDVRPGCFRAAWRRVLRRINGQGGAA